MAFFIAEVKASPSYFNALYGKPLDNKQVVLGDVAPPKEAAALLKELTRYSMKKG